MNKRRTILLISGAAIGVGLLLILAAFVMTGFQPKEFNTAESVSATYEIAEPFTGLDIHTFSSDVRFAVADDGKARVECAHDARVSETVDVENGVLTLRQEGKGGIHFGIYYMDEDSVTVYLPQSEYETLFVETSSGDVDAPAPFVFQRAKISTTSGEVTFSAQSYENLTVETASGDITAAGTTLLNASLLSTSGEVELQDLMVADRLGIRTVSGDVELDRCDAGKIVIHTTSGEVEGTLLSPKTFDVHTTSGSVSVPDFAGYAARCEVTTTSGDVTLRVLND